MRDIKFKKSLFASLLVMMSVACVNAQGGEGASIEATGTVEKGTLVILNKITDSKLLNLDSTYVDKAGRFSFENIDAGEESEIFFVTFKTTQPPGIPVILEKGAEVSLEVEQGESYGVQMKGGDYNVEMQKLYNIYTNFERDMAAFNKEVATLDPANVTEEVRKRTNERYTNLVNSRSTQIENFIKNERGTPATYFAVNYLFQEKVAKLVLLGEEKLKKDMPGSSYTERLSAVAKKLGPTIEGAVAPDINLMSPDGEYVSLSSLRGKVVLIDFWASWCGPCRKENPNVKRVYEKYKDQGFEIYAVSLDNNADRWKAAIAKDGLPWKHVSDLKGWSSSAARLYDVHSIPQTFLIDKEGRIIKAGLRGQQLEMALESIFAK